jgi:precorrin-3B synthase
VPYLPCSVLSMPEVALDTPTAAATAPAVRGACPSGHRPFVAADGLLVRVRVPGGELTRQQVDSIARVAERDGSGVVELTSRANLQIRGVRAGALDGLQADLVAAGLVLGDPAADQRRNVMAAPAAGLDPTEVADVRPMTRELLARLASSELPWDLHPKAGALLDGGGAVSLRGIRQDVALGAARRRDTGEVVAELALGRALPRDPDPASTALVVPLAAAARVAAHALALTAEPGARRVQELVGDQGLDEVVAAVERRSDVTVTRVAAGVLDRAAPAAGAPLGVHRSQRTGTVVVGAAPVARRRPTDRPMARATAPARPRAPDRHRASDGPVAWVRAGVPSSG